MKSTFSNVVSAAWNVLIFILTPLVLTFLTWDLSVEAGTFSYKGGG